MTLGTDQSAADRLAPQRSNRKALDRSLALLLVGTVALMPPIAGIFLINGTILGIPFTLLYVLAVWALLVIGAAALSRTLRDSDETLPAAEDQPPKG